MLRWFLSLVVVPTILLWALMGCTETELPTPIPTATPILEVPTAATSTQLTIKVSPTCKTVMDFEEGTVHTEGDCTDSEVAVSFWKMVYNYNPQIVGYMYQKNIEAVTTQLLTTSRQEARRRELTADIQTLTEVISALTNKIAILTRDATPQP